jgi:ATP-binding cassette subfamily B protein
VVARAKDPRGAARRLASAFADRRGRLAAVLACVVLASLLGLVGPYLLGVALDRFVARGDTDGLGRLAATMAGAYVLGAGVDALGAWWMADLSQRALARLRARLFAHLGTLPLSFFDRRPVGELMSRLTTDIDAIQQAIAQNVTSLVASTLSMVGILVAMFVLDRWLALASLVVVPLMIGFTRWVAVWTRRGFARLQKDLGALNGVMEESIGGQKIVMAFSRTSSAAERFREHNQRVYESGVAANSVALLLMPLTTVLGNLFVIVLVGLGGWLALEDLVSVGVIASFVSYGQAFVNPLRNISNLYNTLQAALAGAERVFEILDEPSERDEASAAPSPALRGHVRFDRVAFGYGPDRRVIHDMSLEARPGQRVALVGPTGAGKTTITNLLTRFYEIDEGAITIDGIDLREIPKRALRRQIGLVLQDTFLFHATVMENLRYGRLDASDDEVREAARLAEAEPFILQLPQGYDTVLSERAGNLSQGQRQLLAIARTMLARPAILVLDEATSSVDTRTEARIQRSLARLMEGRTSFVIAHRLSTIRDADLVLVIDGGRIVERGTHDALMATKGVYHQLVTSQRKGHAI